LQYKYFRIAIDPDGDPPTAFETLGEFPFSASGAELLFVSV
jgi:hypothetical protein